MTENSHPPIMRNCIDTRRGGNRSVGGAPTTAAPLNQHTTTQSPDQTPDASAFQRYGAPMVHSVNTVIAAMELERPGLSRTKRNLLLFFCQGHHLDHLDEPLFDEPIYATEAGVEVTLDRSPIGDLADNRLNTVSSVISRYGNLSPADLRTLIQASTPWQAARKSDGHRIEGKQLAAWFRRPEELDDPDDDRPTASMIAAFRAKHPEAGQRR